MRDVPPSLLVELDQRIVDPRVAPAAGVLDDDPVLALAPPVAVPHCQSMSMYWRALAGMHEACQRGMRPTNRKVSGPQVKKTVVASYDAHIALHICGAQFTQLRVIADLLVVGVASHTRKNLG